MLSLLAELSDYARNIQGKHSRAPLVTGTAMAAIAMIR